MMQMLAAGGMSVISDAVRSPDENNPRGYLEWGSIGRLPETPEIIAIAEGKAIKVMSDLLPSLPQDHRYRVLFMCRPLDEVVVSQEKFYRRLGDNVPESRRDPATRRFERHLQTLRTWLGAQANIAVRYVDYPAVLARPRDEASKVREFLGDDLDVDLDVDAMAGQVDPSLYRERSSLHASLPQSPPSEPDSSCNQSVWGSRPRPSRTEGGHG